MGELGPGSTPRRWLPERGETKLRHKIHKESKIADDYKNLPFEFSKPPKNKRHELFECVECGHLFYAPVNTIMCVCKGCKNACKSVLVED
jgi:hypothetical protein